MIPVPNVLLSALAAWPATPPWVPFALPPCTSLAVGLYTPNGVSPPPTVLFEFRSERYDPCSEHPNLGIHFL
jgi:hypothetical protein